MIIKKKIQEELDSIDTSIIDCLSNSLNDEIEEYRLVLLKMNVGNLKTLASKENIDMPKKSKKQQLIDALMKKKQQNADMSGEL